MIRAFQWDLARQVERPDWLLAQLPRYAEWGYDELYLHLEDAIEYPGLPGVARVDAYSRPQVRRLVRAATDVGIRVVPIVNLLGHTQYLIKVPELRDLNELRAADGSPLPEGQICPLHPRTTATAETLLRDVTPLCTAGKVHVGLDESFHLGKHPLSREEVARIGLAGHFAAYVRRLREVTRKLGLRMGMWADMLYFLPEAIPLLPGDIAAYEWYYYPFSRRPRVELFNFAESDCGERLTARGIEYWGCPMNGAFRHEPLPIFQDRLENILSWWRRCHRLNAHGLLVTSWEPHRLAAELTTVIDAAAASLWLDHDVTEPRAMLERGFARVFGRRGAKAAAQIALACDRHPFAGYPRWEINNRWDTVSRRESPAAYGREERRFRGLLQRAQGAGVPVPLQASIALRSGLAARDLGVRAAQRQHAAKPGRRSAAAARRSIRQLETQLRAAQRAARAMWTRTRDPRRTGPNETMLRADLDRLAAHRRGEPVFGPAWQLCYRVRNFAPAAQLVAVEQQTADGAWKTAQACHTIEFQAPAARPRAAIVREHAAPVDWDGDRRNPPRLRIVLRGIGQVRVGSVALHDGRRTAPCRVARTLLGKPAPKRGFPALDWRANQDAVEVTFHSGR